VLVAFRGGLRLYPILSLRGDCLHLVEAVTKWSEFPRESATCPNDNQTCSCIKLHLGVGMYSPHPVLTPRFHSPKKSTHQTPRQGRVPPSFEPDEPASREAATVRSGDQKLTVLAMQTADWHRQSHWPLRLENRLQGTFCQAQPLCEWRVPLHNLSAS
jgi:hypothetical protein